METREPGLLRAAAREELERMLVDGNYRSPRRRRNLLRYIVQASLAGGGKSPSAESIAQDVFGRGKDFDHQTDPIARLEVHMLRRDLQTYYAGGRRNNLVRITIPKDRYVPQFEWAQVSDRDLPPAKRKEGHAETSAWSVRGIGFAFIAFAAFLIAVVGAYLWLHSDKAI